MTHPDVLILDSIGGAYSHASLQQGGLGGSEIEVLQVAHGLTAKGYSVVVANGVERERREADVTYVPLSQAWQHSPRKALYLQRSTVPTTKLEIPSDVQVVIRANDVYCPPYDVHRDVLSRGRATLVTNTQWQANQFTFARKTVVIPPMLEPLPKVKKQRGLFVFASGAMKGFEETVAMWRTIKGRHPEAMRRKRLYIVCPGWGDPRSLTGAEKDAGIRYVGNPTPAQYRRWIAKAEGLFTVLRMPETFGCMAALAERSNTRVHVLCLAGRGGLAESVREQYYISEDPVEFERRFIEPFTEKGPVGRPGEDVPIPDLRPTTIIDRWAEVLVKKPEPTSVEATFAADPTLASNQEHLGPFFGDFLSTLRGAIAPGGSEFGTGLMLFSLATSIQARHIVEIGRFKGFSTLALAAAVKLQRIGWKEPKLAHQRPDVDYETLYRPTGMTVTPVLGQHIPEWTKHPSVHFWSIDPAPQDNAKTLLTRAGLLKGNAQEDDVPCVTFFDERSGDINWGHPIDLLFIDGDHTPAGLRADIQKFVPWVRPGGYFILHDYFGWFTPDGKNGSPIAEVIAEDLVGCDRVLIDTHYASLVIFRKAKNLTERWELDPKPSPIPPRADGRPTVGLMLIAKGEEASTVATRAIMSAKRIGADCVTVVCDANDATAEVARSLGADVFIRPSPAIDWDRGIGVIAGARNDALAIAERRTDYVLVLDADDWYEGTLPTVLDRDAYEVTIHDSGLNYRRVQLVRSSLGGRYRGIIHEIYEANAGGTGHLPELKYIRGRSSYAYQDQDPPAVKYSKHAHLVSKWLHDHPDDARAQFYLARSYHDAGRFEEALQAYEKRIGMMNGWAEERAFSAYQMGLIEIQLKRDPTLSLLRAHELGTHRAEPLVALARWYREADRRQFSVAYAFARRAAEIPQPPDGIFLQMSVYQFEAAAEVAICAYWLGNKQEALARFEELLPRVPADRRKWAEEMVAMCVRETAQR